MLLRFAEVQSIVLYIELEKLGALKRLKKNL